MEELDRQKIIINDLLMDCITILRNNENYENACNKLLDLAASFYSADRSYIFEFDLGSQRLSNTYEWCAEGIEAEITKLQNLDISIVDRWIAQFKAHGEFYINSTDGELDHDPALHGHRGRGHDQAARAPCRAQGRWQAGTGIDAQLCGRLPAHATGTALARRPALYLWRAESERDAGFDWGYRG